MEQTKKRKRLTQTLGIVIAVVLWLGLWELSARIIDLNFVLPTIWQTLVALYGLITSAEFWKIILFSVCRILFGILMGCVVGIALAPVSYYLPITKPAISSIMTVLKATPVACIIIVTWVIIGSARVPGAMAAIMVCPIIWQSVYNALGSVDSELYEVCTVFELSHKQKLKVLILPTVIQYLTPALLSSITLGWKAGIAAEIISYTKNSIGREIYLAKSSFESGKMFAWTIAVVIISLIFEFAVSKLTRRFQKL